MLAGDDRGIYGDYRPDTLDTYGHLWPDADESTRAATGAVIKQRMVAEG